MNYRLQKYCVGDEQAGSDDLIKVLGTYQTRQEGLDALAEQSVSSDSASWVVYELVQVLHTLS